MREIKFRGKPFDPSAYGFDFVYGYYFVEELDQIERNVIYTINQEYIDVIEESVGQYTGLKDKNGNEIYEGDVVNRGEYNGSYRYGIIEFREHCFMSIPIGSFAEGFSTNFKSFEVIGNIHESPEVI